MRRAAATGGRSFRRRAIEVLAAVLVLYALLVLLLESPLLFARSVGGGGGDGEVGGGGARKLHLSAGSGGRAAPARPDKEPRPASAHGRNRLSRFVSGIELRLLDSPSSGALRRPVSDAVVAGSRAFSDLEDLNSAAAVTALARPSRDEVTSSSTTKCPQSIALTAPEFRERGGVVELPCGLALGSHVTVAATPRPAHAERDSSITALREGDHPIMVSQFMMELQGLKTVDGEDPPRILHFNPRLRGDWSGRPVIEQNTCYRMQWGTAQRCEGWRSRADEETVDGFVKCEKWIREGEDRSEETETAWWLNRFVGMKEVNFNWSYPFVEGQLFVLLWKVTM